MDPSIHLEERRDRRGRRIAALAIIGVVVVLSSAVVGLFGFLEANAAFGTVEDLETKYICDPQDYVLELPAISRLSEIYTADGVLLGKLTERNSQPVAMDEIPDVVKWAVISAEDGDFYEHRGIDFQAIARAAILNVQTGNLTGGSTITQQIVKKNFLSDERTIERKICEAVVAAELEQVYTKDQILEFYMNSQFFGENAYGVKAAAQEYFGKELDELTIAEAAAMVVPIRNPTLYDVRDRTQTVLERRNAVIDQMAVNGFITVTEARIAKSQPLRPIEHAEFEELAPQVIIAAREEVLRDPKYGLGATYSERKRALFGCPASDADCEGGGGLEIYVTVDYAMQQEANRILRAWFVDPDGPTGAIAMVDNRTGAVKVMASGLDFGEDIEAGQRPYDLARIGRRQAGSAFKPFALATALESGSLSGQPITLGSYWDITSPQLIQCPTVCSGASNIWTVYNAGGSNAGGIRTLEEATYFSTNTVYAQVSQAVGPENIVEVARRMGIASPLNPVLSITLGTQSVTPLEMASAYSTLANYGDRVDQYLIDRIVDNDGTVIYRHQVDSERALDEALAASIVSAMKKVVSQGTATRANIGRPQAGKTGTAQNFRDVWFMGFIPQYTTAVWVGYADAQIEMVNFSVFNDLTGQVQSFRRAFGGTLAAPIWRQFMLYVTEDLPVEDFPPEPPGTEAYRTVPNTQVPDVSELTTEREIKDAIYKSGLSVSLEKVASLEEEGTVLEQTPAAGTTLRQGRGVTVRISTGQPPLLVDLRGVLGADIEARLTTFNEETGLQVTWVVQGIAAADPADWGRVISTVPAAGAELEYGQTITVFVGEPPDVGT
jgi:penicillin-binding protein 1A